MENIVVNKAELEVLISEMVRNTQNFNLIPEKKAMELMGFKHTRTFRNLCDQSGISKYTFGKKYFYDINNIQNQIKKNHI